MNDLMLVLETMGSGSNAAIVSIGACVFDIKTGEIGSTLYSEVDLSDSAKFGLMDASTVLWWMKQSDAARLALYRDNRASLSEALTRLNTFIDVTMPDFKNRKVWGNGCTFDNVILGNAYGAIGQARPWPYNGDRDVRTIVDLGRSVCGFDPKKDMPFEGAAHNALDDAIHQAKYVSAIYQRLNAR